MEKISKNMEESIKYSESIIYEIQMASEKMLDSILNNDTHTKH